MEPLIRAERSSNRKVLNEDPTRGYLWPLLTRQPVLGGREILISARAGSALRAEGVVRGKRA